MRKIWLLLFVASSVLYFVSYLIGQHDHDLFVDAMIFLILAKIEKK